jgi:hypothetical protein
MEVISTADLFTYAETARSRGQHLCVQVFAILKQGFSSCRLRIFSLNEALSKSSNYKGNDELEMN